MEYTVLLVAGLYFALTLAVGFWVAYGEKKLAADYFLAGRKLPWYAISLSMTGSNIGTEHFIGMVGTAYAFGLAPATFEWGNFIPYSILAWIFLPYFFRKKLYTIPEFLERRYLSSTRSVFAGLTLFHMVLVVLAPALYAGGRILYEMTLREEITSFNWGFMGCVLLISAATAAYCIYGGLASVVWTDVLQVLVLIVGGLILIGIGVWHIGGFSEVIEANREATAEGFSRLSLILPSHHPVSPWTGVATFWFTLSLWYVGTNQFYIQRCLGARSEWDAKMGVIGCAYIKFILPFIIVFPGLVAFAYFGPGVKEDAVYVKMINVFLHPVGKGILLAALIAAIMSTVSSVLNSASTIWSIDIHKRYIQPHAEEGDLVTVGRWSTFVIILIGTCFAPVLLYWEGGIFIYIQDMAAFLAPPICVIFLAAFLWSRAHGRAATFTLIVGILSGIAIKVFTQIVTVENIPWLAPNYSYSHYALVTLSQTLDPLLNRAAANWVLCLFALTVSTYLIPRAAHDTYDPDCIWNTRWARLPENERSFNRGIHNLMLWWIVMMLISITLFVVFR